MSVAIRLKRHGTRNRPFYRVVVIDSRRPRDGRVIEEVGRYQPTEPDGAQATLDEARVREWIGNGARPSPTVRRILNRQIRSRQAAGREIDDGSTTESGKTKAGETKAGKTEAGETEAGKTEAGETESEA